MSDELMVIDKPGIEGREFTIVLEEGKYCFGGLYDPALLRELVVFSNGYEAGINKVLSKIQELPLSPLQKKLIWKEIKKLK